MTWYKNVLSCSSPCNSWLTWMMVSKPDATISSVSSCSTNIESANKHKIRAHRPLIRFPLKMWTVSVRQWVQWAQSQYLHLWIEFGGRRTRDTPFLHLRPTLACLTLNWMHRQYQQTHVAVYICIVKRVHTCTQTRGHTNLQTYHIFLKYFANTQVLRRTFLEIFKQKYTKHIFHIL